MPRAGLVVALIGAVGLFIYSRASAATVYEDGTTEAGDAIPMDAPADVYSENPVPYNGSDPMPAPDLTTIADPVQAFLYMIISCEHSGDDVRTGRAFRVFYGGSTFSDMSDHPVITGEKKGVPLPDHMCVNAGINPPCVSTAAGAFQMTKPTWLAFRGPGDQFDEPGQVNAARRILDNLGATAAIHHGDIAGAIRLAGQRWASLPGARGAQPQRSMAFALGAFNDAAARLA